MNVLNFVFTEKKISEIKHELSLNKLIHKKKEKYATSSVWQKFNEIYTFDTGVLVKFFFFCTLCKDVVYNSCPGGNTNTLLRHVCRSKDENNDNNKKEKSQLTVSAAIRDKIKSAAANLVVKDLRPYTVIQGEGLIDLCHACMEFGQSYKRATKSDLLKVLPCPKTVKSKISQIAAENIAKIAEIINRAIQFGGLSATTDTWTDDHRHTTYLSIVLHLCIYTDGIKFHRFILGTTEISEMVKTGMIQLQILNFNFFVI